MRHSRGFSVIELLVALTLLLMLLVVLFGSFHVIVKGWASVRDANDAANSISAVRHFTTRLLEGSRPTLQAARGNPQMLFSGSRESVEFVTTTPTRFEVPGLYRVRIYLDRAPAHPVLIVEYELFREGARSRNPTSRILLDDISTFEVRYFGQQAQRSPRRWHSRWSSTLSLPEAIRISLRRDRSSAEWLIPIRAEGVELIAG